MIIMRIMTTIIQNIMITTKILKILVKLASYDIMIIIMTSPAPPAPSAGAVQRSTESHVVNYHTGYFYFDASGVMKPSGRVLQAVSMPRDCALVVGRCVLEVVRRCELEAEVVRRCVLEVVRRCKLEAEVVRRCVLEVVRRCELEVEVVRRCVLEVVRRCELEAVRRCDLQLVRRCKLLQFLIKDAKNISPKTRRPPLQKKDQMTRKRQIVFVDVC